MLYARTSIPPQNQPVHTYSAPRRWQQKFIFLVFLTLLKTNKTQNEQIRDQPTLSTGVLQDSNFNECILLGWLICELIWWIPLLFNHYHCKIITPKLWEEWEGAYLRKISAYNVFDCFCRFVIYLVCIVQSYIGLAHSMIFMIIRISFWSFHVQGLFLKTRTNYSLRAKRKV